MEPRHGHRASRGSLIAFLILTVTAAGSFAPPQESSSDGEKDNAGATEEKLSDSTSRFTLFESGQVRPLAMSPDRQLLFAVNTPDNRLEVFRAGKNRLVRAASIPV